MKKLLITVLSGILLLIQSSPVVAQSPSFLGQDQKYSVVLRGNGEAVVTMRAVVTNLSENEMSTVELRLPSSVSITTPFAYQVLAESRCMQYDYGYQKPLAPQTTPSYAPDAISPYPCLRYEDPTYQSYMYDYGNTTKYQKIGVVENADTLVLTLPQPIQKEKTGAYFLYFRATGMVTKSSDGSFNYTFESLKTNDTIQNLSVGISTDSDLYLKDAKGQVDYRFDAAPLAAGATSETSAFSNTAISRAYSQIGQGSIQKTASNLAPLDSYTVKGKYADAKWKLYVKEIVVGSAIGLTIIAAFFGILTAVIKSIRKSILNTNKSENRSGSNDTVSAKRSSSLQELSSNKKLSIVILVSFIQSVVIGAFTGIFIAVVTMSSRIPYYFGMYLDSNVTLFMMITILLCSLMIYVVLIFGPMQILSMKLGLSWGILCLILAIVWIILFTGLVGGGYMLLYSSQQRVYTPTLDSVRPL